MDICILYVRRELRKQLEIIHITGDVKGEEIAAGGVGDHLKEALQEIAGGEDLIGFAAQDSLSERGNGVVGYMQVFIELAK